MSDHDPTCNDEAYSIIVTDAGETRVGIGCKFDERHIATMPAALAAVRAALKAA